VPHPNLPAPRAGADSRTTAISPAAAPRARRAAGFSLMELLLAATLGAVLVTATATLTGSFGDTVAQLDTESVDSYEATLARLSRDVRYAWWVEVPGPDSLRVADTANAVTEYFRVGDSLLVSRPDGSQGAIISGLDDVSFAAAMGQRLREGPTDTRNGRLYGVSVPAAVSGSIKLVPGNQLAMAFHMNSDAGPLTVDGVDDRLLRCLPDRLDLRLAKGSSGGNLHVELYTSRSPGDARPRPGATALVAFDVGLRLLPAGVVVIPATVPGDPSTAYYAAPATTTSVAIPPVATRLPPGTGYCVVLSVTGSGSLGIVGAWASAIGAHRGVIFRHLATDPWTNLPAVIPMGVYGDFTLTTTEATDVTTQVSMALTGGDGVEHISSACPTSQVMAEDPWLGVVPDESPSLP
jgi:hypothetical protein